MSFFLCPVYKLNKYFWVGDEKEEKLINTLTSFSINRGFSDLAPLTFEAIVLCCGGCPVPCRMFSSIGDSNPLDTWISPQHQHLQIMPSFFSRGQLPPPAPRSNHYFKCMTTNKKYVLFCPAILLQAICSPSFPGDHSTRRFNLLKPPTI